MQLWRKVSSGLFRRQSFQGVAFSVFVLLGSLMAFKPALADSLPAPEGEVLLTVSGDLKYPNADNQALLDMAILASLPVEEFTTNTPWSDGPQDFKGVRLSVLFDAIGASTTRFVAEGLDDYKFTFEGIDFVRYPIIIAYEQNGGSISVRNLGPLRIMFPFDDHPELLNHKNESSAVWQLISIELL